MYIEWIENWTKDNRRVWRGKDENGVRYWTPDDKAFCYATPPNGIAGLGETPELALEDEVRENLLPVEALEVIEITIEMVTTAMAKTRDSNCWYDDPETNTIINEAAKNGWVLRPSTSQIQWTEKGIEMRGRSAMDPIVD